MAYIVQNRPAVSCSEQWPFIAAHNKAVNRSTQSRGNRNQSLPFVPGYGRRLCPFNNMNLKDFESLRNRVVRAKNAVAKNDADGFTQELNSHSNEKLIVQGIKSPEQLEDEILTLCIWIWSMKDYLKTLAVANGQSGQQIENIVDNNDSLAIVADIANRAKHGTLTQSRTNDFAKLSGVGHSIGQSALNSIGFGESDVTIDVGKPENAEFTAKIEFESGNRADIDDAVAVIADALAIWETEAYPLIGA